MRITRSCDTKHKPFASLSLAGALFLLLLLVTARLLAAERNPSLEVNIAAGTSLEETLFDLGTRAGLQLAYPTPDLAGLRTPGLRGRYPLKVILTVLLQKLGLEFGNDGVTLYVSRPKIPQQRQPIRPKHTPAPPPHSLDDAAATQVDEGMAQVTIGSHIPNNSDPKYPSLLGIVTLNRADFAESDFQTLGEELRSRPPNFPGGQNPGVVSAAGSLNIASRSGASSANLHGMGAPSTLTLLDGQRLATSESSGAVDLSLLPISVVERVDMLTGGTSAVYGSDAVAGTANVVLRDKVEGLEVRSAWGGAVDGGGFLQHYSLIGGHSWGPVNAYAAGDCARQQSIDSSQRAFIPTTVAGTTLLPRTQYCSAVLHASAELQSGTKASLVGVYTSRKNDTALNLDALSQGASVTTRSSVSQFATIGTLKKHLDADWSGTVTSSVSADSVHNPEQLMVGGIPSANESYHFDDRLRSIEMGADGTLLHLPTGPWKLAAGAGYNEETFLFSSSPPEPQWITERRRIRYLFGEGLIPLWPLAEDVEEGVDRKVALLSLRLAGRKSWYSDVGSSTNPKFILQYQSVRNFSIGASWGTSYRAPTLVQQYNSSQTTLNFVHDPSLPGGGSTLALFQFGGNPRLRPEISSDVTVNFAFTPPNLPDTLVNITWYDIRDRARIEYPTTNTGDPLSDPNVTSYATRNPSAALISQTLAESPLDDQTRGAFSPSQAGVLIDDLNQNISHQRASGIDLFASYGHDTFIGKLKTSASVAYLDLWQQLTPASQDERLSGTVFNPPMLRSRLGLTWSRGKRVASLFFNYTGPSRNTQIDPPQRIGSWETFDLTLSYIIPKSERWANTRFTLSAKNLLDRRPPFVSIHQLGSPDVNFDSTNASATGAFVTFGVVIKF